MEQELFAYFSKYMTLSEEEKKVIIDLALFKKFKKGTILLKEGDLSNMSYFVIKGCLRAYYLIDGEEKTTAFYTESDSFTPLFLINKTPSDHYLSCVEDTLVSMGSDDREKEIYEKFPRFETLCRMVSEELLAKNKVAFDQFKTSSPEERYLNLLEEKPDLVQRVPQYQLASFLGMKPESLSRIRKRLLQQAKA